MITGTYPVPDLRRAYLPGRKVTGTADVRPLGLTHCGVPIASLVFGRGQVVDYVAADGRLMARYQDVAYIDD